LTLPCAQFKEHLVKRGVEGGRKAAQALKAAIRKQCHGPATEIEVIARVYVNLTGLAQAMRRDGSLESESQLRDFTLGFTQGTPSFDFIDVGGLGHTDIKIQGREQGYSPRVYSYGNPGVNRYILHRHHHLASEKL
jgi:hypothetical protein